MTTFVCKNRWLRFLKRHWPVYPVKQNRIGPLTFMVPQPTGCPTLTLALDNYRGLSVEYIWTTPAGSISLVRQPDSMYPCLDWRMWQGESLPSVQTILLSTAAPLISLTLTKPRNNSSRPRSPASGWTGCFCRYFCWACSLRLCWLDGFHQMGTRRVSFSGPKHVRYLHRWDAYVCHIILTVRC